MVRSSGIPAGRERAVGRGIRAVGGDPSVRHLRSREDWWKPCRGCTAARRSGSLPVESLGKDNHVHTGVPCPLNPVSGCKRFPLYTVRSMDDCIR